MSQQKLGPIPDRSPITAIKHIKPYVQDVIPQPFSELPSTVQTAIIYWMAVVGEAWGQDTRSPVWKKWIYGGGIPAPPTAAITAINRWRAKFVACYGNELVCYTHVPAEVLLLANGDLSQDSDLTRRYDPVAQFGVYNGNYTWPAWPIALCSNPEECRCFVENGGTRLRSYLQIDATRVPVYWFPHASQLKDEKDCDVVPATEPAPADDTVIGSGLSDRSLNLAIEYVCKLASLQGYTKNGETALFWHLTGAIEGHRQANSVDRVRS